MTFDSTQRADVVWRARAQIGKPYQWGAAGPNSYDCSGETLFAWAPYLALPHQSGQQAKLLNAVPFSTAARGKLRYGDLVFYYGDLTRKADGTVAWDSVTHVAVYTKRDPLTLIRYVTAAVDEHYGVMEHPIEWALRPSGFGYCGHDYPSGAAAYGSGAYGSGGYGGA